MYYQCSIPNRSQSRSKVRRDLAWSNPVRFPRKRAVLAFPLKSHGARQRGRKTDPLGEGRIEKSEMEKGVPFSGRGKRAGTVMWCGVVWCDATCCSPLAALQPCSVPISCRDERARLALVRETPNGKQRRMQQR